MASNRRRMERSESKGCDVLLGIDVGKSSNNAVAFDRDGDERLLGHPVAQNEADVRKVISEAS